MPFLLISFSGETRLDYLPTGSQIHSFIGIFAFGMVIHIRLCYNPVRQIRICRRDVQYVDKAIHI